MIKGFFIALFLLIIILSRAYKRKNKQYIAIKKYSTINKENFYDFFKHINNIDLQKELIEEIRTKNELAKKYTGFFASSDKIKLMELENLRKESTEIYWKRIIHSFEDLEFKAFMMSLERIKSEENITDEMKVLIEKLMKLWNDIFDYYKIYLSKDDVKVRSYLYLFEKLEERNFLQ